MATEAKLRLTEGVTLNPPCPRCRTGTALECAVCHEHVPLTGPPEVWLEVTLGEDQEWVAAYRIVPDEDRRPAVAELRVFPNEPGRRNPGRWSAERLGDQAPVPGHGLTARLLRQVKVAEHVDGKMTEILEAQRGRLPAGRVAERLAEHGLADAPPRFRGRGREDTYLASLASQYVQLLDQGSRTPVQALASQLGQDPAEVRDLIHEARSRGLLTAAPKGRAGGQLTERALALLPKQPTKKGHHR